MYREQSLKDVIFEKLLFFQNNTKELDFDYFVSLFEEYYLSDDPSDLGNFINGRLEFPTEEGSDAEAYGNCSCRVRRTFVSDIY